MRLSYIRGMRYFILVMIRFSHVVGTHGRASLQHDLDNSLNRLSPRPKGEVYFNLVDCNNLWDNILENESVTLLCD